MIQKDHYLDDLLGKMGFSSFGVIKNLPVPIIAVNMKEEVYWLNDKAKELFGDFTNYPYRNVGLNGVYKSCLLTIDGEERFFNIHVTSNRGLRIHTLNDRTNEIKLENQVGTDPLTGLNNRLHMDSIIEREMNRSGRYNSGLSILMFDLDDFKTINDSISHNAGDIVLGEVGKIVKKIVRDVDIPFRYGGDEFLVVFPNTPADRVGEIAERIREKIEKRVFGFEKKSFTCTISAGIAGYKGDTLKHFIEKADKALYQSKEAGRNKITVAM